MSRTRRVVLTTVAFGVVFHGIALGGDWANWCRDTPVDELKLLSATELRKEYDKLTSNRDFLRHSYTRQKAVTDARRDACDKCMKLEGLVGGEHELKKLGGNCQQSCGPDTEAHDLLQGIENCSAMLTRTRRVMTAKHMQVPPEN